MTVCVAVAVNDCLVFAADSASTLVQHDPASGESRTVNVYAHGDKVFNLYKGLPIAAMTCGMGNIGYESIATLAKELRTRLGNGGVGWQIDHNQFTIEEVAARARRLFFEERYQALTPQPAAPHSFEFWIGGYGSRQQDGHQVWKIAIADGNCGPPELHSDFHAHGFLVGGQVTPVARLIGGFDPMIYQALKNAGIEDQNLAPLIAYLRGQLEAPIVMPTMPVKDAIELADFLVDTTKRYFRFMPGADIVGGDTDVAVVTRYEGFKWIRRKHFYPLHLNPLETDHG